MNLRRKNDCQNFYFTIQCYHGHFIYKGQADPYNLEPLSMSDNIDSAEYGIAYLCL
jgi:hypothetical protein